VTTANEWMGCTAVAELVREGPTEKVSVITALKRLSLEVAARRRGSQRLSLWTGGETCVSGVYRKRLANGRRGNLNRQRNRVGREAASLQVRR